MNRKGESMKIDTDEAMNRHYIPDGVEYSGQHNMAVTQDWLQGWDACKELADAFPAPQPAECEPVAWMNPYGGIVQTRRTGLEHETYTLPLYTTPQPCPKCDELQAKVAELTKERDEEQIVGDKLFAKLTRAEAVIEKCNLALELNVPLLTTRLAAIFAIAAYRGGK